MARKRMTRRASPAPQARRTRKASPPPAMPTEYDAHPAEMPDPDADQYENGDTVSWAEEPHVGPTYGGAPPAMPTEYDAHPAAMRMAAEKVAGKAIRIAQQLLGPTASTEVVENQAFDFMGIPEARLDATLGRMAKAKKASSKKANRRDSGSIRALTRRIASMEDTIQKVYAMLEDMDMGMGDDVYIEEDMGMGDDEMGMGDDEALLEEMLVEEGMGMGDEEMGMGDDEALLEEMLVEEDMGMEDDDETEDMLRTMLAEEDGDDDEDDKEDDDVEESEMDIELVPSGMEQDISEDNSVLASLYPKTAEDEEDEDEVEIEDDEMEIDFDEPKSKKAFKAKPRRRKASTGAKSLGRVASSKSLDSNLSSLWTSAPDVSDMF